MTKNQKKYLKQNIPLIENKLVQFFSNTPFISFTIKRNNIEDYSFFLSVNGVNVEWRSLTCSGRQIARSSKEKIEYVKRQLGECCNTFLIQANIKESELDLFYDKFTTDFNELVYWSQRLLRHETVFENGKLTISNIK